MQYQSCSNSSSVRYAWRLLPLLESNHDNILHVTGADYVLNPGSSNRAVTLVLTRQAMILVNIAEDSIEKILSLKDLSSVDHSCDTTMLCLRVNSANTRARPLAVDENGEVRNFLEFKS